MSDQWFVHSNGEQMGPYTGQQLVEYAQQGNIVAETMVWAEGMAEWAPASQIPGLFPEAPAPEPVPVAAAVATTSTAWAPPGSRLATGGARAATAVATASYAAQAPVGGAYPYFQVKSASFGLWLGTLVGGFVLFIIAMIMLISGAAANVAAQNSGQAGTELEGAGQMGMAGIVFIIASILSLASMVFFCMNLYRAWACLQPGGAQTTPGKAIGFMFIPFYNLYWVFVAINGLPKDWNRIVASYEDLKAAPKLSETTFMLYCIGVFFAPLAFIMIFPMMSQLCKGINFFASRRNPNAPTSAFSALGRR
jgi:hypothetical protein